MKKLFAIFSAGLFSLPALAQTFPTPTFNSLTLQNPLSTSGGGTGTTTSTGTGSVVLSNSPTLTTPALGTPSSVTLTNGTGLPISTGVSGLGTGVAAALANPVTGSGAPVLATSPTIATPTVTGSLTATGLVTTTDLATQAANTVLANATGSMASPTAIAVPSCSTSASALNWTTATGFACNTSINAATLGGSTFAAPGPIGSTTPNTGAFTNLSASGTVSGAGFNALLGAYAPLASPTFTGTPSAPTASVGTNTTQIATTAFVASHAPCPSILDHGGNNGGSVDNSTAFANTIAANPSGQACIYFPPGTYAFSSALGYNLPTATASITIQGAGPDVSTLKWAAGGGMQVNITGIFNSVTIQDLSVVTGAAGTGNGIVINNLLTSLSPQPISHITNVAVHGADGYGNADYWGIGILVNNVNNVNIINPSVWGGNAGIGMEFTSGTQLAVQYDVFGADIQDVATGIMYMGYSQGLSVNASNIVGCTDGIKIPSGSHTTNLVVTNSQLSCKFAGIEDDSGNLFTQVSNNLFIIPPDALSNASDIFLSQSCGFAATGNVFYNTGAVSSSSPTFGLLVGTQVCSGNAGSVVGNVFQNLYYGAYLQSGSSYVNVQSNAYGNVTNKTTNLGANNTIGGGSP